MHNMFGLYHFVWEHNDVIYFDMSKAETIENACDARLHFPRCLNFVYVLRKIRPPYASILYMYIYNALKHA